MPCWPGSVLAGEVEERDQHELVDINNINCNVASQFNVRNEPILIVITLVSGHESLAGLWCAFRRNR